MNPITLTAATNDPRVNAALRGVIAICEAAFPRRICAYYVDGSYADGSGLGASSDLDLTLIVRGSYHDMAERDALARILDGCALLSAVELDVGALSEDEACAGIPPALKLAATLVYGEECRAGMPLLPLDQWTRDRMHSSLWRAGHLFNRPGVVEETLTYPDPDGAFYGYDSRMLRLPDGREVSCTRDLIRLVGWAATALIAYHAGRYVARKGECHTLYRACIGDEWSDLLEEVYRVCRGEWRYLIPEGEDDRQRLRAICARTLAFENHFLREYKPYLLAELRSPDTAARAAALDALRHVPYHDPDVEAAQHALNGAP